MHAPTPSLTAGKFAQLVEAQVVGWRINRLRESLQAPLAIVTTGSLAGCAKLWARSHEADGYPAWVMTPYDFIDRGVPKGTNALFLSPSGRHHDVLSAAKAADSRRIRTHAVVTDGRSPLVTIVRQAAAENGVLILDTPAGYESHKHLLTVPFTVVIARLYGPSGPTSHLFNPLPIRGTETGCKHVVALGVGFAQASALELGLRCRDSGLASATVTDAREFTHGAAQSVRPDSTWFVLLATQKNAPYTRLFAENLPSDAITSLVISEYEGVWGGVHLMAQAAHLYRGILQVADANGSETNWQSPLFYLPLDRA